MTAHQVPAIARGSSSANTLSRASSSANTLSRASLDRARTKAFLAAYAAVHGCGPSLAQIADALNLPTDRHAGDIVAWLIENRHAERAGGSLRARWPSFADNAPLLPEVPSPRVPTWRRHRRAARHPSMAVPA